MSTQRRIETLKQIEQLICVDRPAVYGDADRNLNDTAKTWSVYLGREITATDVCCMMALMKVLRLKATKDHRDSMLDAAGYMAIAASMGKP